MPIEDERDLPISVTGRRAWRGVAYGVLCGLAAVVAALWLLCARAA